MTFELKMTKEQVVSKLRDLYGAEFTTPDVRAFCAMNDITQRDFGSERNW